MVGKTAAVGLGVLLLIPVLIAALLHGLAATFFGSSDTTPSQTALDDIPGEYLALYLQAAPTCPGLDWSVLAAIGKVETDHGRVPLPGVHDGENHAGAGGPMQFLQPTFDSIATRIPPGGAVPPSRYDPHDAIHAAALYLCDSGAPDDLYAAIFAYNRADWYVAKVLAHADTYSTTHGTPDQAPTDTAQTAINYAMGQLGLPYVWGGNGPDAGHAGFDCSGLTTAAYTAAEITLPRTAHTQYHAGPRLPDDTALLPGDLVFYGNPATKITHVGLYLGNDQMIHAPTFGQPVQIGAYRWDGDRYAGARRIT
ncbi:cell wall-associated NlpC family hydrolase [Actinoalloteichus hoggarensis]|uniref:Murein DD-endopeptidase MepH n=1 Tax=Actinoalloteichus hoggarensis TaxID=1470176 RepID=A0A221W7C9_9PSEU|nr:bifunctional lytic transglycosylase/C40 family peptidase [Actinoalloteichus hoggarensis]ASO21611.1 Murein DD-endopeptidase MepH precursor [Actinoalloteichus hoggarensis]MBB5922203.1 cell wall-associated NlpC family hydrolase [Actinoalloteichus hoggarensis]